MPTAAELAALRQQLDAARAGAPLVITTSGSTLAPKRVAVSWSAMAAAAQASAAVLGSGHWLHTLPAHYIAGAMVEVRAQLVGTQAQPVGPGLEGFAAAAAALPHPRFVSLVPAQLAELLADENARPALASFEAVLVGGQSMPKPLRAEAEAAGIRVVATYGSTETSGGCVYDGRPLPGVQLHVDDDSRLWIAGPMLADGYLDAIGNVDAERTASHFVERDGRRWYRTDDRAELLDDDHGQRLRILGRMDEVLISGGLKLDVAEVQRALDDYLGAGESLALAVDGTRWGQSLGVWRFDAMANEPTEAQLRDWLIDRFGPAATPIVSGGCVVMRLDSGKLDRAFYRRELRQTAADRGLLVASITDDE